QPRRKIPIALRGLGPAPAAIRFTAISPLDVRVHVTTTENLRQNPRCSGAAWAARSKICTAAIGEWPVDKKVTPMQQLSPGRGFSVRSQYSVQRRPPVYGGKPVSPRSDYLAQTS